MTVSSLMYKVAQANVATFCTVAEAPTQLHGMCKLRKHTTFFAMPIYVFAHAHFEAVQTAETKMVQTVLEKSTGRSLKAARLQTIVSKLCWQKKRSKLYVGKEQRAASRQLGPITRHVMLVVPR